MRPDSPRLLEFRAAHPTDSCPFVPRPRGAARVSLVLCEKRSVARSATGVPPSLPTNTKFRGGEFITNRGYSNIYSVFFRELIRIPAVNPVGSGTIHLPVLESYHRLRLFCKPLALSSGRPVKPKRQSTAAARRRVRLAQQHAERIVLQVVDYRRRAGRQVAHRRVTNRAEVVGQWQHDPPGPRRGRSSAWRRNGATPWA